MSEQIITGRPPKSRIDVESTDLDIRDLTHVSDSVKIGDGTNTAEVDADGHLQVHNMNDGLSIAKGEVTGNTFIHKFGSAPDFDTADGEVTIWDGASDGTLWENMMYDYSTTADIDSISSSNAGDTQDIEIQGLDTNYALVTQTRTLNGQTRVALSTNLIRVFRLKNVGSTDLAGVVSCFVNTADTTPADGVPDDTSKIRAILNNGNNQTLMALYTIPAGKTGYMRSWYAATAGASRTSNYIIKLKARPFGQVFQLKHVSAISDAGTSAYRHDYVEPEVFAEKTDIQMSAEMTAGGGTAAAISAGFDIVLIDN